MLQVTAVSKTYGGVLALRDLSFVAAPGQVVGLLGPNGSGKSTALNVITGLLQPTRGSVRWRGRDIHSQLSAYQTILGYVPEEPRLYGYQTAPEYLAMVGALRDLPADVVRRRTDRYLELFGLGTDRYAPLSSFSKGMRQKVLISGALLHDPELVVLDEPDSGLDVGSTLVLRTVVGALAAAGKVVLYSSHVLDMVEKLCSDAVILHHGRVVVQDSIDRLRRHAQVESLEEVFAALVGDQNIEHIGRTLASIGKLH